MHRQTLLTIASIPLLSLVGCAAPADDGGTSVDALEESAPRISADELATKAEARFNEVEALDPGFSQATSTVVFAIDDAAPVTVEEEALEIELPAQFGAPMLKITAMSSPIFYLQRGGALTPGTSTCAAANAGVVVIKEGQDRYRPAADLPCTIAITKVYQEDFGTGPAAAHAHALQMRERTIVVGTITTKVKNEAGTVLDVRAAFVLPTKTPFGQ